MRRKSKPAIPEPSLAEVQATLPKSETIHLRVTKAEKTAIRATAGALRLSITEYLLKCHAIVAGKIGRNR
jgi:uncharacterized protein (DUF1778 family)